MHSWLAEFGTQEMHGALKMMAINRRKKVTLEGNMVESEPIRGTNIWAPYCETPQTNPETNIMETHTKETIEKTVRQTTYQAPRTEDVMTMKNKPQHNPGQPRDEEQQNGQSGWRRKEEDQTEKNSKQIMRGMITFYRTDNK